MKNIQKMDVWEIKQMEIYVIKFIYGKKSKNIRGEFKAN